MDVNSSAVLPPTNGIICLVDDDPSMLRALDRLLSSVGLQAQLFSEPLGFLSYVVRNSVALVVIDIWMSDMSGLEVFDVGIKCITESLEPLEHMRV